MVGFYRLQFKGKGGKMQWGMRFSSSVSGLAGIPSGNFCTFFGKDVILYKRFDFSVFLLNINQGSCLENQVHQVKSGAGKFRMTCNYF